MEQGVGSNDKIYKQTDETLRVVCRFIGQEFDECQIFLNTPSEHSLNGVLHIHKDTMTNLSRSDI